jgi:hypothetical protein
MSFNRHRLRFVRIGHASAVLAAHRPRGYRPAMSVSPEQVRHIANLARIAMSDE